MTALRRGLCAVALLLVVPAAGAASKGSSESPLHVHEVTTAAAMPQAIRVPAAAAATWCGTATAEDLVPNVVAGNPVHWIYAIPSDGPDRFATFASVLQTDAEAIDAWWRREDPVRTLRSDLARFTCGTQLDLTSLRLRRTGAQLDGDFGFGEVFDALGESGFASQATRYLVYYDGPVSEANVCGRGGGAGGIGLAVVYVRACIGASTAAVAAHEVLHTLGAVDDGAPNNCPPPNDGHVCDNENDLMYWSVGPVPLEGKLLDAGRDDYYGHASPFTDTQDAPWLVQLDRQVQLRVNVTGPGRVAADVPGLECAWSCTTTWNAGTGLRLTATPSGASKLVRWSGACRATGPCSLTVASGATVSALFAPRVFRLAVGVGGQGSVRASRRGILCRPRCSASLPSYVPVRLTATPAKGWKLRSWVGACRGSKRTCTVPMSKRTSARAVFARVPMRTG
jgi:hypothetical protein